MPVRTKKRSASAAGKSAQRSQRTATSRMDAIDLLEQDHEKVLQLLTRMEETTERNATQRNQLLRQIENEIKVHTRIEEELFYPEYKEAVRSKSDKEIYFEAVEEHHVVDLVMAEIKTTDVESEEFGAKAKVLKDLIEHHIEEERNEMFPKSRRAMGAAQLRELGDQLKQRKEQLMSGKTWIGRILRSDTTTTNRTKRKRAA